MPQCPAYSLGGGVMIENKILWTRNEVAAALGVSSDTVSRWTKAGRMPSPFRVKSVIRYHRETIEAWAREGCPFVDRHGWEPPK